MANRLEANDGLSAEIAIARRLRFVCSCATYNIPDYRLEHPEFRIFMSGEGSSVEYRIEGDLSAAAPPIRDSKYLSREQCIDIYRWMLLNRRMEVALENLYKQGKVVGGVYFGLGTGRLFLRVGLCAWRRRLARADDPQPGCDAGARLQCPRHHAAVHGQGRFPDLGARRLFTLWRLSRSAMFAPRFRCWAS